MGGRKCIGYSMAHLDHATKYWKELSHKEAKEVAENEAYSEVRNDE